MVQLSATLLLTVITIIASFYAWNRPDVQEKWMFNPYKVAQRNEYFRFLTSGFIHADLMHLAFNMIAFYSFGQVVETYIFQALYGPLGSLLFTVMYLLSILVADLPSYFKYRHAPGYNSLGASGGVSAVVFIFILFTPLSPLGLIFIPFLQIPGFIFGAFYMAYSFYMARQEGGRINHDAHIWGAIFGIFFYIVIYPDAIERFIQQISGAY